ncbi:hypothetical protein [Shewanella putrefaciens]|uniref:hypothetical protein n=2 Tax=Shewanella TaxID=22 RepID=UPI003564D5D6
MGVNLMDRRIISAVAWAFSSCLFLWLFSLAQAKGLSNTPTYGELFESFTVFSFMLLGGGACYHFLTEIIFSPYNPENSHLWMELSKKMVLLMSILVSVPLVILLSRDYLPLSIAWLVSFFYLLFGMGTSVWIGTKIEPIFNEIRSNKSMQPTDR